MKHLEWMEGAAYANKFVPFHSVTQLLVGLFLVS